MTPLDAILLGLGALALAAGVELVANLIERRRARRFLARGPASCEACGSRTDTRPVGPRGAWICFTCAERFEGRL